MKYLILGCGYLGKALAQQLVEAKQEVVGVVRSEKSAKDLASLGIPSRIADCSTMDGAQVACKEAADVIVFSLSSKGGDYRKTYVEGMSCVLSVLKQQPPQLFIYTGSTSVYAQNDQSWVTEQAETKPLNENAKLLLEAEGILRDESRHRFSSVILRASGIYGPERSALLSQLREGAENLPGNGNRWVNQIHRDDVVGAVVHLAKNMNRSIDHKILNVSDDTPVLHRELCEWLCEQLNRPMPRYSGIENDSKRRDAVQNRRISNQALKAAGWKPMFPSYREGYRTLLETK